MNYDMHTERHERPYRCRACGKVELAAYTPRGWYSLMRFDPFVHDRRLRAGLFCTAHCLISYGGELIAIDQTLDGIRSGGRA